MVYVNYVDSLLIILLLLFITNIYSLNFVCHTYYLLHTITNQIDFKIIMYF